MRSFVFVALLCFVSVGMVLGCVLDWDDHTADEKHLDDMVNLDDLDDYDAANNDTAYSDEADYDYEDYNSWVHPEWIRDDVGTDVKKPVVDPSEDKKDTWQAPSHEEAKHTKTEDQKDPSPKTEPVRMNKMIIEKSNDGNATIKVPLKKK